MIESVFILCSQASWNKYFIDYQDEEIIEEAKIRRDEDILENDERFPFEG